LLTRRGLTQCALCAIAGFAAEEVNAETPPSAATGGIKRTILHQLDGPAPGFATVMVLAEIDAGATVARHTHPGIESAYVMEGGGTLSVDGQPELPTKSGSVFQVPADTPHVFKNGDQKTRLQLTLVVEKGKPLASPA
jgi:quercetin dioxygenase-like cupin family protein